MIEISLENQAKLTDMEHRRTTSRIILFSVVCLFGILVVTVIFCILCRSCCFKLFKINAEETKDEPFDGLVDADIVIPAGNKRINYKDHLTPDFTQ